MDTAARPMERRPSTAYALATFCIPVAVILYGTVVMAIRPPVLPLIAAVGLAALMVMRTGYRWNELQQGMFEALGRVQIAVFILVLVGMLIGAWIACGTIPLIIYWGLRLIAPESFLLSSFVLCGVASIATGTSFGTMGTLGVALLGVGEALGFPAAMTVGAVVSGAYLGDKMSPASDSTNIAASVCEVDLFDHIGSMMWTTVPAALVAGVVYSVLGVLHVQGQAVPLEGIRGILSALEQHHSLSLVGVIPPLVMLVLAYMRLPVVPVMAACVLSAAGIALFEGHALRDVAVSMTTGFKSATGVKQLDMLLSRGGMMSVMPTVLLLSAGVAFGGVLERSRTLEVLIDAVLRGARSTVRLVGASLLACYIILLGTGSQLLAAIIPGRAFAGAFREQGIHLKVLSRTCEDGGTIGCPLVPWSVHAFYILGVLGVGALDFGPYAILNWIVPVFSMLCAATGVGVWRADGTGVRQARTGA